MVFRLMKHNFAIGKKVHMDYKDITDQESLNAYWTEARRWDGLPDNPSQDGWHWLHHGRLSPAFWNANKGHWEQGGLVCGGSGTPKQLCSDHYEGGVKYIGPCVLPTCY